MAVVRLATMPPGDDVAKLLARIDALERRLSGEASKTTGSGSGGSGELQAPRAKPARRRGAGETGEGGGTTPIESRADLPEDSSTSPAIVYDRLRSLAQRRNRGLFAALEGGRLVAREAGRVQIELPTSAATRQLQARIGDLEEVCERFFGEPTRVTLETKAAATPGPDSRPGEDRARRQRKEALSHPNVNQALEILGGEIVEIRPLGGGR
jgi:DNA polymerase-3 subunit gamma/tau